MKTAVIYARYSSERQTEQSIEGQLRACMEYAQRNNIAVVGNYIDRAMTGTNDNRADFQRMLKDSAKGAWDFILVYKLDRFSRNKYEATIHKHTLTQNGVRLVSVMENIPDTPEGIILESLLEGMNQYYSAELSQKIKRGNNENRKKGLYTGGFLIYGYQATDKKLAVDPDKAKIVLQMFELYASGLTIGKIVHILNEKGIRHRGKPFPNSTVRDILRNEKYTGVYHYKDEEYRDIYPQIISKPLFDEVNKRMDENRYGRHGDVLYLLKNKMYCGCCGSVMSSYEGTTSKNIRKRYYCCYKRKKDGACKKACIRKETIETLVVDITINALSDPSNLDLLAEKVIEEYDNEAERHELALLVKEKKATEKALENLLSAIEQGIILNSTKERLAENERKVEELDRKIAALQSAERKRPTKEEILSRVSAVLTKNPFLMIRTLIDRIILYDDKVEIYYKYISTGPAGNERRGCSFYQTTAQIPFAHGRGQNTRSNSLDVLLMI